MEPQTPKTPNTGVQIAIAIGCAFVAFLIQIAVSLVAYMLVSSNGLLDNILAVLLTCVTPVVATVLTVTSFQKNRVTLGFVFLGTAIGAGGMFLVCDIPMAIGTFARG